MLNEDVLGYMLSNSYKRYDNLQRDTRPTIKNDISDEEAMKIFNEVIDIYKRHNITYECALRITMALNESFIQGAVELYEQDMMTQVN